MSQVNMSQLFDDTLVFNTLSGNLEGNKEKLIERISAQLTYIFSELTETLDGYESTDPKELADGCVDILVTAMGLAQIMHAAGFDMEEVGKRIGKNNLSKFPVEIPAVDRKVYSEMGYTVEAAGGSRFVLKDKTGKVRKPLGYQDVDLEGTYDPNFFGDKQ